MSGIKPYSVLRTVLMDHSFSVLFLLTCAVSLGIRFIYQKQAIVVWDEAHYSEWIYWTIDSIRSGNWDTFISLAKQAISYPPLYTLIYAIPLSLTDHSMELIRLLNLGFFMISSMLTYTLALGADSKHKKWNAIAATLFFLFSPMVIIFATIALREMLGTMFTLLFTILYSRTLRGKHWVLLPTSIVLICLIMVKYNYGTLIIGAFLLNEAFEFFLSPKKSLPILRTVIVLTSVCTFMAWWLIRFQNSLTRFIEVLTNKIGFFFTGESTLVNYLLFYPRGIVYMYTGSILLGSILLVAFLLSILYFRNPLIRFMWLASVLNIILGTIHIENMEERYIFTIIPFVFVLAAITINRYIYACTILSRRSVIMVVYAVITVIGLFIARDFLRLPRYVYAVGSYTNKTPLFNEQTYTALQFDYDTTHWVFPLSERNAVRPKDVFNTIAGIIDVRKPTAFIGESNEFSQPYRSILFNDYRRHHSISESPYSEFAVITDMSSSSKFYTWDYRIQHEWKMQNRFAIESTPDWIFVKSIDYPSLGIKISIYGKNDI